MADGSGTLLYDAACAVPGLPLLARPAPFPEAGLIPPREWLLGTRLVRRFVSLMLAPGGVGKSAVALASAVSLASGRNILGEHVHHSVRAWVLNLEDPADELNRRIAACMKLHGIPAEALRGRLFTHAGRERRVVLAEGVEGGVVFPDRDALLQQVVAQGIGLVVVDPFVRSHGLDENSNVQMDLAMAAWAEVAEASGAAVLLVHHTRKPGLGGPERGGEASRGAKSVVDAARSAVVLAPMAAEEAEPLGVPEAERWRHVRMDDAKANLAPRGASARWFRMETVDLGNGTVLYPRGDQVVAVAPWAPESPWAGHTVDELNAVLDVMAEGPVRGALYAPTRRGALADRWAGKPLMQLLGVTEAQATAMLAAWLRTGLLEVVAYRDPQQRRDRQGVRVEDSKRPGKVPGRSTTRKELTHGDAN